MKTSSPLKFLMMGICYVLINTAMAMYALADNNGHVDGKHWIYIAIVFLSSALGYLSDGPGGIKVPDTSMIPMSYESTVQPSYSMAQASTPTSGNPVPPPPNIVS